MNNRKYKFNLTHFIFILINFNIFDYIKMVFKFSVFSSIIGFLVAFASIKFSTIFQTLKQQSKKQYKAQVTLLGDIGGTNLRLQLVSILPGKDIPIEIHRRQRYDVKQFATLQSAIQLFLRDSEVYPLSGVIAIAGPIINNSVQMANAPQWGRIYGKELGDAVNISDLKLINDFEAVSYGLLLLKDDDLIYLNGKRIIQNRTRGVIGPGTGLGNSVLFNARIKLRNRVFVLPSEGGHGDYWHIDQETNQFFQYIKRSMNVSYINVQRAFTGPTLPVMYRFFAQKYPHLQGSDLVLKGQEITNLFTNDTEQLTIPNLVLKMFLKVYGNTIGNFIVTHLPIGGIYLIGSITKSFYPYIQRTDILQKFKQRHPQMKKVIQQIPIVFAKQMDLGLKGAFVYARRRLSDRQS